MLIGTLCNNIDKLWETFWEGWHHQPLTVIEEITYLLLHLVGKEKRAMQNKCITRR